MEFLSSKVRRSGRSYEKQGRNFVLERKYKGVKLHVFFSLIFFWVKICSKTAQLGTRVVLKSMRVCISISFVHKLKAINLINTVIA